MTIPEAIERLKKERQNENGTRFPCRAIMVDNIEKYCYLLEQLKESLNDAVMVASEDLFSDEYDIMPRYSDLTKTEYQDQWLILPGVSEYLRLFRKDEMEYRRFGKLWKYNAPAEVSKGRIIIPLWGCEAQWFDPALNFYDKRREEDCFWDCTEEDERTQQFRIQVFSGSVFEQHISKMRFGGHLSKSLREWYEYWCDPNPQLTEEVLLTGRFRSVTPAKGDITIEVIPNLSDFVRNHMDNGKILEKESLCEEAFSLLFPHALKGRSLEQAVLCILNQRTFSAFDAMKDWRTMALEKKQLIALFIRRHPDKSYLSYCVNLSAKERDISNHVLHDIFTVGQYRPEWIEESKKLISTMGLIRDAQYFEQMDQLLTYEERLPYLTGDTKEERIYLIRMIGNWMKLDAEQVKNCSALRSVYPRLYAYLDLNGEYTYGMDSNLSEYFRRYRSYKLKNTLPEQETVFSQGVDIERFHFRFSLLSDALNSDCVILWVDALSAEWLPLLNWTLRNSCEGDIVHVSVAQAVLPTSTRFNEEWNNMGVPYQKLNKLDILAHRGIVDDPDYYACIEEQINFVSDLTEEINALLKQYRRVIITGDHGASRLAARFFHKRQAMNAPFGAVVGSHGRYCQIPSRIQRTDSNVRAVQNEDGNFFLVCSNYDHFTKSGFAAGSDDEKPIYGEIHGGASPEEVLVPVIVADARTEKFFTAQWERSTVKIIRKKSQAVLKFSGRVQKLQVKVGSSTAECLKEGEGYRWKIMLSGLKQGVYNASIIADGVLITVEPLTVISLLGDDSFP